MNNPKIEVSWGELFDKITILEIKSERIKSAKALSYINKELKLLNKYIENHKLLELTQELIELNLSLKRTNNCLWDIEDSIRKKEKEKKFDKDFISLARSVYIENDKRSQIKRKINLLLKSELMEEKSYENF